MKFKFIAFFLLFSVGILFPAAAGDLSISLNNGAEYTNSTSVSSYLNGNASASVCALSNDGSTYDSNFTPSFPESGHSWTLSSGDGLKTVYFKCANESGNWSAPVTDTITLDTTDPSASSLSPSAGSVTSDTTPTVSAQLSDSGSGLNTTFFYLYVDGTDVTSSVSLNPSTGILSYTPVTALSVATHNASMKIYDQASNEAEYSWSFIVNTGVSLTNLSPSDNSAIGDNTPRIAVNVVASAGINNSLTVFNIDGANFGENSTYSGGVLSYEVGSSMEQGTHTVSITVYDNTGVSATTSGSFIIDTIKPSIGNLLPQDTSTQPTLSVISASIGDSGSGINQSSVQMYVDGINVTEDADFDDGVLRFVHVSGMADGSHNVEVVVFDNAGNRNSQYWSFSIEKSRPVLSSRFPEKLEVINNPLPGIFGIVSSSGASLNADSLVFYLDAKRVDASFDESSGKIAYTPNSSLSDGVHTVRIRISNQFGNTLDESWTFSIDTSPSSSVTGLSAQLAGGKTLLSWSAPSSSDVNGYEIYVKDEKFSSTSGMTPVHTASQGTLSYEYDGLKRHYFAVVAVDSAGNKATPVFGQNCGTYRNGQWSDYECCWDSECGEGSSCSPSTHACAEDSEPLVQTPRVEITRENASKKLDEAEKAVLDAAMQGKNVTSAGILLNQAKSAFNVQNYEQAYELSKNALLELSSTKISEDAGSPEPEKKKALPCCPGAILLPMLTISTLFYRTRI